MVGRVMAAAAVAVFAVAAAALVSAASGGTGVQKVLSLERVFPVEEKVELEVAKARDRARHARMLQGFSGGIVDFPVTGSSDPYAVGPSILNRLYFTKVRLGSPPRDFNVQIDTGSDILWVNCGSCENCPQSSGLGVPLTFFDSAKSSTASRISCSDNTCANIAQTACTAESDKCGYSFQYGDGSGTTGYYVSDLLYFDTIFGTSSVENSSAPIVFGCSTSLYGDLTKSDRAVDGIIGFGQKDLSVISQLSSRGITPKVFSHCLKGEGNGGGVLVLGEILDPRIVYTPLVPSQSHYNLFLESISVNGQLLPIDQAVFATSGNQGTIVDSGTTLAYLVEGAYDPFVDAITAAVSPLVKPTISRGNQCYLVPTSVSNTLPLVSFNFAGDASLVLKPTDYLIHTGFVDGSAMWCMGFLKVENQGTTIFGGRVEHLVLKDKIFVYDLARQRLGWADYDCSLSVNVSVTSSKDDIVNAGRLSSSSGSSFYSLFRVMHERVIALLLYISLLIGCFFL
ncbi:eukaryotic aspartyl protease family protein [Striga asiatica]|uniref:Eukaryotic aspartyl protease family protein n=1 Tax=Striga asiatica TaxID=4170 RepID=A0A5A7R9K7_STRAF|nr:eukaryotic aspartyl protease family protein [Striga asiatica]